MMQGSAEWFAAKLGKVSGSHIGDIMARVKPSKDNPNCYSKRREKYMRELLIERLTGINTPHYTTEAMMWGMDQEEYGSAAYEAKNGVIAEECGFFDHPTIAMCGASPDRLIGLDGVLEIKDPTSGTHIDTLLYGTYDEDYIYQMSWEVECTGRKWADFVSYDSRLPANAQYFQQRFIPDESMLASIREEVVKFIAELDAMEAKIREYKA